MIDDDAVKKPDRSFRICKFLKCYNKGKIKVLQQSLFVAELESITICYVLRT